jgi:hypothetical protein
MKQPQAGPSDVVPGKGLIVTGDERFMCVLFLKTFQGDKK